MFRRALFTVLAAATIAGPAVAARGAVAPVRGQTLMPGVVYTRQVQFTGHGPVVLNIVSTPRPGGLYSARALLADGAVPGRRRLSDLQRALSPSTTAVGVNGDFFNTSWGTPSSVLVHAGLLTTGSTGGRSAAGFDATGALRVDKVTLSGSWKGTGQNWPMALNAPPARNTTTLYTASWGPSTPPESGTTEVVLAPFPPTVPNQVLTAPALQVAQGGNQAIPADGAVLVARGPRVQTLATEAPVGTTITIRLILTPPWSDVVEAVGGGPALVRAGRPVFRSNESFSSAQLFVRTARAAVGQTADGRLLLAVVDGGRPGYSTGMTNFELALALLRNGAVNACALGTGAAAGLAFDGKLLSRPSGTTEAAIADALVVAYDGVYALPPPTKIAAAHTITLAYKVVRSSTVSATVASADGTSTALDAGLRAPGIYRFDWAPPTSGRWTFTVTADDDLGRHSAAVRQLVVGQ